MGFDFAKCARCGAVFTKVKSAVCLKCQPDEEADYRRIRDALAEHPDPTVESLAETAGVAVTCVRRMLAEGLIENTAVSEPAVCGRCGGRAISTRKRLCEDCLKKLNMEVGQALNTMRMGQRKPLHARAFGVDRTVKEKRGL